MCQAAPRLLRESPEAQMAQTVSYDEPNVWKGAVAGAAAGLVASWIMTRFHVALSGRGVTGSETPQSNKPVEGGDDAAMKAADEAARLALDRSLSRREKTEVGGPAAHYVFGAAAGAMYGML